MTTIFTACAVFGGTILICQTLMTLLGLSSDHDMVGEVHGDGLDHIGDHVDGEHHSSTWFFGIVTFRTAVAAITFFGLAGMTAVSNHFEEVQSLVIAGFAGFAAMYAVHWLMRQIGRLRADGSVRIEHAVGMTGNVYLRVPGSHQGAGKIHLNLQNRTVELIAWTEQAELPTGATIVVTKVVGPDSVEVVAASA